VNYRVEVGKQNCISGVRDLCGDGKSEMAVLVVSIFFSFWAFVVLALFR
jgi:hypothetical protein